jgi:hypothetical protein
MRRFLVTAICMLLFTFTFPSISIAADLAGPKVSQRNSTSFEDATNSGITIDIFYTVEDESGVDENKIPETFIRLPGKELETSLRARPTLISGSIYKGSWLARFTYSKGIPPGIYVASTSTWYDTQSNPSSIPTAVTIRVDNLAVTTTTGENTPPSNLKCNSPQQIYPEEGEVSNNLSASIFCTFTANSLRTGYKVNAYIDKIPLNVAMPTFNYVNDQIIYPVVLAPQKISKSFNLIGTFTGEYTLRIIVEFLGFPNLTQTFTVKLSETSNGQLPVAGSESKVAADKVGVTNEQQVEFDTVKNNYETMMLRIANLKIKYPNNSNLIGMEAKMLSLPIILGKDLSTAKYNIVSVNKWLDGNEKVWEKTQKKTITCVKSKTTKNVVGTNPKCPKGYKVKF